MKKFINKNYTKKAVAIGMSALTLIPNISSMKFHADESVSQNEVNKNAIKSAKTITRACVRGISIATLTYCIGTLAGCLSSGETTFKVLVENEKNLNQTLYNNILKSGNAQSGNLIIYKKNNTVAQVITNEKGEITYEMYFSGEVEKIIKKEIEKTSKKTKTLTTSIGISNVLHSKNYVNSIINQYISNHNSLNNLKENNNIQYKIIAVYCDQNKEKKN